MNWSSAALIHRPHQAPLQTPPEDGPRFVQPAGLQELLSRIRATVPHAKRIGVASCREEIRSGELRAALEQAAACQGFEAEFTILGPSGQPLLEEPGSPRFDGVLLIVASGKTEASELRQRVAMLRRQGQRILGILLWEEGSRPPRRGGPFGGRAARPTTLACSPALLGHSQLADEADRLRRNGELNGEPFAALAIYRTDTSSPVSELLLQRLLACRAEHRGRIGRLAAGGLGLLLPATEPQSAVEVAADIHSVLARLEPKADWSIQVLHHPAPTQRQSAGPPVSGSGISLGKGMDPLFAYPTPRWKRTFDLLLSAGGLLAGAPLLLLTCLLVKFTSRGPIFFCQWRSGHGGRPFRIIKFRTMVDGAERMQSELAAANEQDGPAFKMRRDPRVTFLGRFLRRSCIDELPQLWNVLRGEMSLVGPRPLPLHEQAGCRLEHQVRLRVDPGMTCFWQARGREMTSFEEWMQLDLEYVRRRSLWRDLGILLATTLVVLPLPGRRKGSQPQQEVMTENPPREEWSEAEDQADAMEGKTYART